MFTIDANVWMNSVTPTEARQEHSREFLKKISVVELQVIVPTLLRVELAATFGRTRAVKRTVESFTRILSSFALIRWISLDEPLADVASTVAANHQLRGADAVYAAVAMENNCTLISMDDEHLKRLTNVLEVLTPEQAMTKMG